MSQTPHYAVAPTSLIRVLRYTAALSEMMERSDAEAAEATGTEATTTAELLAPEVEARRTAETTAERMVRMFEALVREERAVEIARIIVVRTDGGPINKAHVESDEFPSDVFTEAFEVFERKSSALSRAALGLRSGTGSPGSPESATNPSSSS